MRHIVILITLILFSSILEATYLRSIRVGSFSNKTDAKKELIKLNNFIQKNENLLNLQKKWGFECKARKSGKYYVTLVEPLKNKEVLQIILDILRIEYKDVYVTRLKQDNMNEIIEKIILLEPIQLETSSSNEITPIKNMISIEEVINTIDKLQVTQVAKTKIQVTKTIQEEYQEEVLKSSKNVQLKMNTQELQENIIWKISLFLSLLFILLLLRILFVYKKEKKLSGNKDLLNHSKIEKITEETQNKDRFLSNISQELRTSVTAIIGLTQLMLNNRPSTFQKDYVQRIKNSTNNLLRIIDDISDISKIQVANLEIENSEFNINDTLEYVLTIILIQANNNKAKILLDVEKDVPSLIVGDSLRLSQVMISILLNAINLTKAGSISLGIRKLVAYKETIKLEFVVKNNDIQIRKSQEKYLQTDIIGLGLSISKQLIEKMGGEIFIESTKDKGNTFIFTIVFTLMDTFNRRQYRLPSKKLLKKKVLLVDSSEENINSLIDKLNYFHYEIHSIPSFEAMVLEDKMEFDFLIVHQSSLNSSSIRKLKEMAQKGIKIVIIDQLYKNIQDDFFQGLDVHLYLKTPLTQQSILNMIINLYASKTSVKIDPKHNLKKLKAKKILIAEDNELNHKLITSLLSDTGIELSFVFDGQEAVNLVQSGKKFNLILMDINMPKLNGYEASEEIRKNNKYNSIRILALNSDVMESTIEKTFASGMQGYISKPIILDMFYHEIYQALSSKDEILNIMSISRPNEYSTKEEFKELSVNAGLRKCDGDLNVYKSTLVDFKAMYMNSSRVLEQLVRDSYFKEAKSLAMDIKNAALNVGAYNLCESAAAIKYEFEKGSKSNWTELLGAYKLSLEKLFKDLDKYIKKV